MDGALGADRHIAVKAEVGQLFLRVRFTHVSGMLCLAGGDIIVGSRVAGLRDWGVGLGHGAMVGLWLIGLHRLELHFLGLLGWGIVVVSVRNFWRVMLGVV